MSPAHYLSKPGGRGGGGGGAGGCRIQGPGPAAPPCLRPGRPARRDLLRHVVRLPYFGWRYERTPSLCLHGPGRDEAEAHRAYRIRLGAPPPPPSLPLSECMHLSLLPPSSCLCICVVVLVSACPGAHPPACRVCLPACLHACLRTQPNMKRVLLTEHLSINHDHMTNRLIIKRECLSLGATKLPHSSVSKLLNVVVG